MHTAPKEYDSLGISKVHNSMLALNQIITDALVEQRARPYSIQPSVFTSGHRIIYSKIKELVQIAKKLIPVTFGDVIHVGTSKYSILSGDAIMTMLARALKPNKVIFATNVDGILRHESSKEIIREIRIGSKDTIEFDRPLGADVTGGMRRKVQEATTIAALGMDVHIVNGLHPERVIDAIEGKAVTGTVVTKRRTK
jgi:isopentenyl phosphate kinase